MNAIQRRRLLKLADYLEGPVSRAAKRSKHKKFDMSKYGNSKRLGLSKNMCNTAGCALGWATNVFPRTFRLRGGWNPDDCQLQFNGLYEEASESFPGAQHFFGLTPEQAEKAFSADNHRNVRQEAALLRRLARAK